MTRYLRRTLAIVATLVLFWALMPAIAQATLDDWPDPVGVSSSNPSPGPLDPSYPDYWWRQGWGNKLEPDISWNLPKNYVPAVDGQILGQLYTVDRDPFTIIDTNTPDAYGRNTYGNTQPSGPFGNNFTNTYDMLGALATDPTSSTLVPGATSFVEGQWYIHALYYSTIRYSTLTMSVPLGIDITPPRPVTGLKVSIGPGEPAVAGVVPTRKAHLTWNEDVHDDLSGDAYYQILLDDRALDSAEQGRVYSAPWLPTPSSFTIEDMPPGNHKLSVVVVDRATNESTAESVYFASDTDTPTIEFTSPLNGAFGVHTIMSAEASDSAGNPTVVFGIDGSSVATISAPPYSFRPDLSSIMVGTHVLSATAIDSYGRSVTVTEAVSTTSLPSTLGYMPSDWESLNSALGGELVTDGSTNGWENRLRPRVQIPVATPDPRYPDEGVINGILYVVDKSADTTIDITAPDNYFHQAWLDPTVPLRPTIDLLSVLNFPPVAGWPALLPGENSVVEGQWYLHYAPVTSGGFASPITQKVPFRMDVTDPTPVTGLVVSPSINASDAGTWTSGSRAHVSWTNGVYDDLAGLWYYEVTVDGTPVSGGRVEGGLTTFTIEDMPAGSHAVGVRVVDNAGNSSPVESSAFKSDPDTPTVSITAPASGGYVRETSFIAVNAEDQSGSPTVTVAIDGSNIATLTGSPYAFKPDLSGIPAGPHVLSATAVDHLGRSVTVTEPVTTFASTPPGGLYPSANPALDASIPVVSATNPSDTWRQGWGNSLRPKFNVQMPGSIPSEGQLLGILYAVDRSASTQVDIGQPLDYFRSGSTGGPSLDWSVDLGSVLAYPPVGGWPALEAGAVDPAEGSWYLHFSPYTQGGYAGAVTQSAQVKIDVTAPRALTGFTVSPSLNPADGGVWTTGSRAHLAWNPGTYDDLSGVAYYKVYVDGVALASGPGQDGALWELTNGQHQSAYTLENLAPGRHTISIAAVDRATNEGPRVSADFFSDPDVPTIHISQPTSGFLGVNSRVVADVTDLAGIRNVKFAIDGSNLATLTAAPYSTVLDVSGVSLGAHVLRATATDFYGHSAVETMPIIVTSNALSSGGLIPSATDGFGAADGWSYTSDTNPASVQGDLTTWFRGSWGNTLHPKFAYAAPAADPAVDGLVIGMLYTVDKDPNTVIDITQPERYLRTTEINGTLLDGTVDILGTSLFPPVGGWPALGPGENSVLEGHWYVHVAPFTSFGFAPRVTSTFPLNIDITAPRVVQNFSASPSTDASDAGTWGPSTRAHLTWSPLAYDDLAGVAYYNIYLDGKPAKKLNGDPLQVFDVAGHTPTSVTIENMPAGDHVVGIAAVDRALNEGPITTAHFFSDVDTPTVSFKTPAGDWIDRSTLVSVDAADDAGNPTVVFAFDGVTTATVSAPPYSFTPNIDSVPGGTHVITATATDHLGRTATATKTVYSVTVTAGGYQPNTAGALDPVPGAAGAVGTPDPNGQVWSNTLTPKWSVTLGNPAMAGMLYTADKNPSTQIDMTRPSDYFFSTAWSHTLLESTIDIPSLVAHPPLGGWPAPGAGETSVSEGKWYVHYLPVDNARHAGTSSGVATLAIDLTSPTAATNLAASPTTNPADAGPWTGTRRANITWSNTAADALSGIRYYQVYLDGAPVQSTGGSLADGQITDFAGKARVGLTIENMTAGTHQIQVSAVDWAGNEGPKIATQYRCDLVAPTVKITSPAGSTLNRFTVLSADAADDAGNPTVVFALDGSTLATVSAPPYTFTPDMSTLTGGPHLLSATAIDHMGRTATDSKMVDVVLPSAGLELGPTGALDTTLTATCDTNPNNPLDPNAWWRNGWGNTLKPEFTLQAPTTNAAVDGWVMGLLYAVDKDPNTVIDINTPEIYSRSSRGTGTDLDTSVDMIGVINDPPLGGWPALAPGENSLAEGVWYLHYNPFTTLGYASSFTRSVQFKVDLTAPRAVAGLIATPTTTPTSWAASSRVKLSWTPGVYDDLSGVAYYRVFIDGVALDAGSSAGRLYDVGGKVPSVYTIENAPVGAHTFSISAVDRAGNEGPKSSVIFRSDPDTPKLSFTSPLNGFLNSQSIVAVNATDLAGNPVVTFGIDGVTTATVSAPPYSFKPDITGLVPGVHVLSATAVDFYGHSAVATLAVTSVSSTSSAVGGFEPSDSGLLDGEIAVSSETNPIPTADADSEWRLTWGNSLHPKFVIAPPAIDPVIDGEIQGMLYTVDKSASTIIDISHPDRYFRASQGTGTNLDATIDLAGTLAFPPVGGWPALATGETSNAEGQWYLHFTLFTTKGYAGGVTHNVAFKIDTTKPRTVNNLTASPTTNPSDGGVWTPATRAHIAWTPGFYDSLAGVAYYRIYIDGTPLDATQGKVWEIVDKTPSSLTIENMPAGLHHVAVAAVDRAGNEGPLATTDFMSDPAGPTVSITSPTNGIIDSRTTVSANAVDDAGDPTVVFSLDSTVLTTLTSSPYNYTPDVTSLPAGPHVLTATATDHLGRSATATMAVTVIGPQPGFESDPSGALDGPVGATSETNPNDAGAASWWRQGWGNSLYPQISVSAPAVDPGVSGYVVGTLYAFDKSAGTTIDIHHPELYSRSSRLNGTNQDTTIDLLGVQAVPPVGGWPALGPGENSVSEGTWYYHTVFFSSKGYAGTVTRTFPLRIDRTNPRAVAGLTVSPTTSNTAWGSTSRATLEWTPGTYDDLSGVAYYRIYLDGAPLDTDATQGRVYEVAGKTPSSFTLENMPAGHHTLSVSCVDRATNEGPLTTVDYYTDPDVPTIKLLAPLNNRISARTPISVEASDLAGDPRVVFQIDGVTTATVLAPPYSYQPKITGLSAGVHTILVTAYDHLGRMASVTTTFSKSLVGAGFLPSENEALNGPMTGTSSTNPNDPNSSVAWWRNGWGKTLQPQFTINAPAESPDEGFVIGMLYTIDKNPATSIDITRPDLYSRASRATGTNLNTTVDIQGVLGFPPVGGWPAPGPGEVVPGEGMWYMHFAPFTSDGYASATDHYIVIGVDLTKPRAVSNLVVSPSLSPADANQWVSTSRAIVTWSQGVYDDLSGVAYYQVYVDGEPVDDTVQGHVFEVAGKTPTSYTIENMPAGMHKVSVAAVDRAGNVGPLSNGYFYSDPDVPTIAFGSFSRTVGVRPNFTVKVADNGGVRYVRYTLDGQLLGTITDSPWDIHPDLSGFSAGSHILTAMVADQYGHTAQVSTTITLDKSPMTITGFSRTPSIFYPIIKDGYYDYSTIKYTTNKSATVTLTVRNSAGTTVRTIKVSVGGGAHSLKWDGIWSKDGKAHTGTFSYQITAVDAIGQKAVTGKLYTTIRDYQIIKTSSNTVKVIPR